MPPYSLAVHVTSKCPGRSVIRQANPKDKSVQYAINPAISLPNSVSVPKFDDTKLLQQVYPHNPDVFILQRVPPKCTDTVGAGWLHRHLCTQDTV